MISVRSITLALTPDQVSMVRTAISATQEARGPAILDPNVLKMAMGLAVISEVLGDADRPERARTHCPECGHVLAEGAGHYRSCSSSTPASAPCPLCRQCGRSLQFVSVPFISILDADPAARYCSAVCRDRSQRP